MTDNASSSSGAHRPDINQLKAIGDQFQQLLNTLTKELEQSELDPAHYAHHSLIPDVVERYRLEHKMSKGDMALLSGVTPNTLTKLLKEHPNMRVETVLSILGSLGLTLYVGPIDG